MFNLSYLFSLAGYPHPFAAKDMTSMDYLYPKSLDIKMSSTTSKLNLLAKNGNGLPAVRLSGGFFWSCMIVTSFNASLALNRRVISNEYKNIIHSLAIFTWNRLLPTVSINKLLFRKGKWR